MRTAISLLLLPLLLLCDRSAAGSCHHGSVGAESEPRDGVTDDIRLREAKPNQVSHSKRSAVNWTFNSRWADFPCPDATAITPCVCKVDDNNNIDLDCTFVESEEQLAAVFQQELPVKELHEFSMANNSAIIVLRNILNGVTFQSIELSPGPFVLEYVTDYFISDNKDTLTNLRIEKSQLTSDFFPFPVLSQMEVLDEFSIYDSSLTWIPPITAPKISLLGLGSGLTDNIEAGTFPIHEWDTDLYLYYNQIVTVEPGSFFFSDENSAASSGALTIRLHSNQLQSLQAGTFPLRNADVLLYLFSNQIASIEPGMFVLPEATGAARSGYLGIDLSYNQLQSLQAGTFPLRNAYVVLHLYNNQIASIEPGTFVLPEATGAARSGYLLIDLSYNQLQSLQAGTFPLWNVEVALDLDNNQIASIEPGTFVLPEATDFFSLILHLYDNQLTTVDEAVFGDLMPFISTLYLYDNPLFCGCDIAWLVLNDDFLSRVASGATCADGTKLHDLDPQFYTDFC